MLREQEKGWRAWFDEENVEPIEMCRIRCCGATSLRSSAPSSKRSDWTRGWHRAPVLERQADQRSDEWVDRYRAQDAEKEGATDLTVTHLRHHEYPAEREERPTVGPTRIGLVEHRDQLLAELLPLRVGEPLLTGRSAVPVIHSSTGCSPVSSWM